MNPKVENKSVYVMDKFRVPSSVLTEFLKQTKNNLDFIKKIPGCMQQTILKQELDTMILIVTIVGWENEEKLREAKAQVQGEHKRLGFNPPEFLKRLNVELEREVYQAFDVDQ